MKLKKEDFEITKQDSHHVLVYCYKADSFIKVSAAEGHDDAKGNEVIDRWILVYDGPALEGIESCKKISYKTFDDVKKAISFAKRLIALVAE